MITIENALRDFLLDTRSRLSQHSTVWYERHLRDVVEILKGTLIDQVPTLAIRQYLVDLRDAPTHHHAGRIVPGPLSHETQRGRHRALKTFFNWAVREYDLDPKVNPMRKIKTPSSQHHQPKAVDMNDVRKMLAIIGDNPEAKRDRALIYFLLDTGCRLGGLITLTLDRLDMDHRRAIVIEKGDRARVVPFSQQTAGILTEWLLIRPAEGNTLFCRFGSQKHLWGQPLSETGVRQSLRRLAKRAGVTGRINPHSFRHGFAREFLTQGGSMPALQQILGHSTPTVTMQFYARWDVAELAKQHELYSPLQGLKES